MSVEDCLKVFVITAQATTSLSGEAAVSDTHRAHHLEINTANRTELNKHNRSCADNKRNVAKWKS